MLALHPFSFLQAPPPLSSQQHSVRSPITRTRVSMDPVSKPAPSRVSEFPHLLPSHRDLMSELISSIEDRLGPTLLPCTLPPDVQYYENPQGSAQAAVDIRSGGPDSTVHAVLESWIHCKLPNGDLNITTIFAILNSSTDAPHLVMEFIQGGPTSLVLFFDLLPRKDLVLHQEYLDEFYTNTGLDKLREDVMKLPRVSPYYFSSLYLRSIVSPTAITVNVKCGEEGEGFMEEMIGEHVGKVAKEMLGVWLDKCADSRKELEEGSMEGLLKRDELIKSKSLEIDLAANIPRMFGPEIGGRVIGEIEKALKITEI